MRPNHREMNGSPAAGRLVVGGRLCRLTQAVLIVLAAAGVLVVQSGCTVLDRQKDPEILDVRTDWGTEPSVGRGAKVQITLVTDDPDNDELDFRWIARGGKFEASGRDTLVDLFQDSVTVVWQAPGEVGTYDLVVEVSDGRSGTVVTQDVRITVTQVQPRADAGPDRALAYGDTLRIALDGSSSSDPDGDELRFVWTQIGGPRILLQFPGTGTPSFLAVAPADYVFILEVRDDVADPTGALTSDPDTVVVRVNDRGGRGL